MLGKVDSLTAREKEALRLLSASYDAKSAAAHLGVSVHTINEHLRSARRKLGVSSSRAAARLLSEAESGDNKNFVSTEFGEANNPLDVKDVPPAASRTFRSHGWLIGGPAMLASALVLMITFSSLSQTTTDDDGVVPTPKAVASSTPSPLVPAAAGAVAARPTQSREPAAPRTNGSRDAPLAAAADALAWLALVDEGDWHASWRMASSTFQGRIPLDAWAARAEQLDRPSGALVRVQQYATMSASIGSDSEGSVIIQYQSASDTGARVLETIALVDDGEGWKVSAYFTHPSPPGPVNNITP